MVGCGCLRNFGSGVLVLVDANRASGSATQDSMWMGFAHFPYSGVGVSTNPKLNRHLVNL